MAQNVYDDPTFFEAYSGLARSVGGPQAAMEWPHLQALLPVFEGKRVLDLGCGFGGLCRHASHRGARWVVGVDSSRRMLLEAVERTVETNVSYQLGSMSALGFAQGSFDVVLSTLALHYVARLEPLCAMIAHFLAPGGDFVASFEHPIFTATAAQDWCTVGGQRLHWPVDNYQSEGPRETNFMGGDVLKYHRTAATYINSLIDAGFVIRRLVEPGPDEEMLNENPAWAEASRRPVFMLVAATKARHE